MVLGIVLLVCAFSLTAYNIFDGIRAERASEEIAGKLIHVIDSGDGADNTLRDMPTVEIDGYLYIGVLEIPGSNLTLPVMYEWDYERLKVSPCRYSGSYFSDDLVICAHNYARHFSPIKWLDVGEDVYFTTVEGQVYHYTVSNRETIQPTSVEQMTEREDGLWDLTLFTCNTGGQTRCAVRCTRVPQE